MLLQTNTIQQCLFRRKEWNIKKYIFTQKLYTATNFKGIFSEKLLTFFVVFTFFLCAKL